MSTHERHFILEIRKTTKRKNGMITVSHLLEVEITEEKARELIKRFSDREDGIR